jgi:hypothetical protein
MNDVDTTSSTPKPKRPVGVTIVGVIAIAGGLLSLFGGASVLSGMASGPSLLAVIVVIFGVLGVLLGAGLIGGKSWAWMPTIIVYVLSIPLGIVEILYGGMIGGIGGVIRIVAGIVIPLYLSRASAKAFFKQRISIDPGK